MSNYSQKLGNISNIPKNIQIAFITADLNSEFTTQLENVTEKLLEEYHFRNITKYRVPWAFEIPGMIERIMEKGIFDLIYCFWVVVRGATTHYDYVCNETSRGIMDASIRYKTPIIFGLLTCESTAQVQERISENPAISGLNLLSVSLDI